MSGAPSHDRGTTHFIRERLSSLLLIPLTVWFIATMVAYVGADHAAVVALLSDPIDLVLMASFVIVGMYHSALGVQVVIEDYFANPRRRTLIIANYAAHILVVIVCLYALVRIAF